MITLPSSITADRTLFADGKPVVGFDVGGTNITGLLVGDSGGIEAVMSVPTPRDSFASHGADLPVMCAMLSDWLRDCDVTVTQIGLVVPGTVDEFAGIALAASNLGWRDVPVRRALEAHSGLPVVLGHDVRTAGKAEALAGAGRPFDDVVYLSLGTGIAAAVFIDGQLRTGTGLAGEIGHVPVCGCSPCENCGRARLEDVASASGLVRLYNLQSRSPVKSAKCLVERVEQGDEVAVSVWNAGINALAHSLSQLTGILAPEVFVFGGGLAEAQERLLGPLTARLEGLLSFQRQPHLLQASFGEWSGVVGAALAAQGRLHPLSDVASGARC